MPIICDWKKCGKKARWAIIDMESMGYLDARDNEFPVREAVLYCGEHRKGQKDVYVVPIQQLIPIKDRQNEK